MVLTGGQGQHVLTVGEDDEAGFLALEKLLDDHARARLTHRLVDQHMVDCGVGFVGGHRDDNAFAGGQAVGFDHDRRALALDVGVGLGRIGERLEPRGRDVVALEELLGEILGAFELRGGLRRPEDTHSARLEQIDDAGSQRRFGSDHGQIDLLTCGKSGERARIGDRHVHHVALARGTGVAGCDEHLLDVGALRDLPGKRVFAAASADDEYLHTSVIAFSSVALNVENGGCR